MTKEKNIFIEGENIENLFSDDLHPFLKWGMTWLFLVGLTLLCLTYFLKWPEVVKAPAVLTSSESPAAVVPKVQAKINDLFFATGDSVASGEVLLTLESTANVQQMKALGGLISVVDSLYFDAVEEVVNLPISYVELDQLGEVQTSYEQFLRAYRDLQFSLSDVFLASKLQLILSRKKTLERLGLNLSYQRNTLYLEYQSAIATYQNEQELHQKGSVSAYELREYESLKRSKLLGLQNIKNSIIQNERQLQDLQEQKISVTQGIETQKNNFIQSFKSLKSTVVQWKTTYELRAPTDGVVSLPTTTQLYSVVSPQSPAVFVLQHNSQPAVLLQLPQNNLNKIDTSKTVRIKLNAYSYEEYGVLLGKIRSVSKLPIDGAYEAQVALNSNLETSFGKKIVFVNGLQGEGEIVLDDERLMVRLLKQFRQP